MKTVTMIDSYKKRNGYLCWFLSVFLEKIDLKGMQFGNDISSNRYLLIHFTLNIIVYYSLHSCCFFKRKLKDILLSFKSQ